MFCAKQCLLCGATLSEADAKTIAKLVRQPPGGANGSSARPDVQVQVLIEYEALRGQTDAAGITDAGAELAPEIVRKLACDAEIIPIMLDGPGGSADVGRARRTVSARLRRALIARDRHCVWPGCKAPPSRCDAHHIWHWMHDGPTNLANLALLCHTHHHDLHTQHLTIKRNSDGIWTTGRQPRGP